MDTLIYSPLHLLTTVYWHHFAHHCHFTHPWGSSLSICLMTPKNIYVVIDYYILKYEFSGRNLTSGIIRGLCADLRIGNDGVKQLLLSQLHFLEWVFCFCEMLKIKSLSYGINFFYIAWEMAQKSGLHNLCKTSIHCVSDGTATLTPLCIPL